MNPIRRVLLSVSDKTGLKEFARALADHGAELLSTGGTARSLREAGIAIREVSDHTGFPEILDGRVKSMHPRIQAGLLARRDSKSHLEQLREHGIPEIDMVVVNFYPFRETAARADATFEEIVEQIDIGGPAMVRAAAKNHAGVAVVTDPLDYGWIMEEMKANGGKLGEATRFLLARKAFALTAGYDASIAEYLSARAWSADGPRLSDHAMSATRIHALEKTRDLRYGENPHQRAALYRTIGEAAGGVVGAEVLQGKELSYNNLLDADAAWNLVQEFDRAASAVIKHTNPSGVGQADTPCRAYVLARDCDPVSAFGSVVAFNRAVDVETAREIERTFVEVVLAPEFHEEALAVLGARKNLRLLRMGHDARSPMEMREIGGGFLVQDRDVYRVKREELRTVTRRAPGEEELEALLFGWRVVKHVKSNAIVFSTAGRTVGIGAGQMSRVDSVKWGAQRAVHPLEGCAMASDAFFPFADGILAAAECGVRAVIQPGGSVRDGEVIEAADAHDMAMVFTGIRHFRH